MVVLKKFNCPTCNAGCGLLIEIERDKIVSIRPDPDYSLTKGYCCPKGIALGAITNDKDRILRPLKRTEEGFKSISWKVALKEIAEKVNHIKNLNSPNAIAYYMGTNSVHQYAHGMFVKGFMDGLRSKQVYNAGSVDNNNKFVVQNFLYGSSITMPIPDLPKTNLLILIGTNPAVTNLSLVTCSNVIKELKEIIKRGGEIYVIDPRRTETVKILTKENDGYHVPIYPDTDIYFLMAMMNVIFEQGLEDKEFLTTKCLGIETLKPLLTGFRPELAEACCGIPKETIRNLAIKFARTKKAVIYGRLGTCLSTFATLNAWAIDVLNIITGKLDRPGGAIFGKNLINISRLGNIIGMGGFNSYKSRVGKFPEVMGAFPLGILAREILSDKKPVKVLFVSGGNPLLSAPNSSEFKKALEKLELCVILDFYINETAKLAADYILPTRTPLENSNAPVYLLNYQVHPHVEYSHAVIKPDKFGPKPEWEILLSLSRLMRLSIFNNKLLALIPRLYSLVRKVFTPEIFIRLFLFLGQLLEKKVPKLSSGTYSLKKLKKSEVILLGANQYGVLDKYLRTRDKKIHLMNELIKKRLLVAEQSINEKIQELKARNESKNEFVMIGRRDLKTMNSWMHNVELLWRNKQEPKLLINPKDAGSLHFSDNEEIIIENDLGSITVPIQITDDIIQGVICYPHGWGHHNPYLSFAAQHPGKNVNLLTNSRILNPLSGQPVMNGYKVFLRKIPK